MDSIFTPEEMLILSKGYPDEMALDPLPSLDEIVAEFLRRHDIFVSPISSKTSPGPLANAAMGAMGPAYLAINSHLTQQQKSIALQEWTSWKQWALSHDDFPFFREKIICRYEERKEKINLFIRENYDALSEYLRGHKTRKIAGKRSIVFFLAKPIIAVATLFFVIALIAHFAR